MASTSEPAFFCRANRLHAGVEVDGGPQECGLRRLVAGDGPPGKGASQGKKVLAQLRALGQQGGKFPADAFQRPGRPVLSVEPDRDAAKRHRTKWPPTSETEAP